MKRTIQILHTSYKNYVAYIPDIIGINIVFVLRIIVIATLYMYLYDNFSNNGTISGVSLEQITYAVIIAQAISTSKPRVVDEIQRDVKSGKISSYLLNPFNYIYFKFLEFFPIFIHNLIIGLTIGLIIGFLIIGTFPLTFGGVFGGLLLLIGSMFVVFFGYMMIGLLAFYTEDVEAFRFIYSKADMILGGNLIPIQFLPGLLQTIAFLSPFAYFGYTTGLVFTNFELLIFLKYFLIQMIWLIINISVCIILYNHAKNKLTINGG